MIKRLSEELFNERLYSMRLRMALPLEDKVALAKRRITEWRDRFGQEAVVDYSGGKDSQVLLHLAREVFPDMPALFVNTGLEFPELVKAVRATPNAKIVRPETSFKKVLETCGWPVISKAVSEEVHFIRTSPSATENHPRVVKFKKSRWRFLLRAPFKISQNCCHELKMKPIKLAGGAHIIGTRADESRRRRIAYILAGGCNLYEGVSKRSAPLSAWSEQDVLRYVKTRGLSLPSVYGDLVEDWQGRLSVTGRERTGCMFCLFGIHMDGYPNRFELIAKTHPKHHDLIINRLGAGDVLKWLWNNAPSKLRAHFRG